MRLMSKRKPVSISMTNNVSISPLSPVPSSQSQPPLSSSSSSKSRSSSKQLSASLGFDPFSQYLSNAEQHNLLLKQQAALHNSLMQGQHNIKHAHASSTASSRDRGESAASIQRKTYEAMIADISKAADISAKINSYSAATSGSNNMSAANSHEAKVIIPLQTKCDHFIGTSFSFPLGS